MSDYTPKCRNKLPIIFDDRMPVNNLIPKIVNRVNDNTDDLKNLYEETETIQEDVTGKLDAPESAGTAGQVLTTDGTGGTAWATVGSGEIVVDPTLSIQGAAADAKVTGDEISGLKSDLNYSKTATPGYILRATNNGRGTEWSAVGLPTDAQTAQAVSDWLDEHPEATTTVQDDSLTEEKFTNALRLKTLNMYVTPEMYGAKGDGTTDDTVAVQAALAVGLPVFFDEKTYKITSIVLNQYNYIFGANRRTTVIRSANEISISIPRSADHCIIEDLSLDGGGIEIGYTGTASVQDMHTIIRNIIVGNGYGIKISQRGGRYSGITVGSCEYGFLLEGSDNLLYDCVTSTIERHGYSITGPNNAVIGCKAFLSGHDFTNSGKGFFVSGAFARIIGCEAQQNYYEGFWLQNSHATTMTGCISDGNFWNNDVEEYVSYIGTIPTSQMLIHASNSCNVDCAIVNGSIFGQYQGVSEYGAIITQGMLTSNSIIFVTNYNRNNVDKPLTNRIPSEFTNDTNLIFNNYRELYTGITEFTPTYVESLVSDLSGVIQKNTKLNTATVSLKFTALRGFSYLNLYIYNDTPPAVVGVPLSIYPNSNNENVVLDANGHIVCINLQANTEYTISGSYIVSHS